MSTSVSSATSSTSSTSTTSADFSQLQLDKDDFLELLIAQLKNQDPLDPTDSTEYVAQLAQFSSLEQLINLNSNAETIASTNTQSSEMIQNAMMMNYIGKDVTVQTDTVLYSGSDSINFNFVLYDDCATSKLVISDENGKVVDTINCGSMNAGENSIEWDGECSDGTDAASGVYTFSLTTQDAAGNNIENVPYFEGTVESVCFEDGTPYISVDGVWVPYDGVTYVTESE